MEYTYTKDVKNSDRLILEIVAAIGIFPLYINTVGTTVMIGFSSSLSAANVTALNNCITAHVTTTPQEAAEVALKDAKTFGRQLILQCQAENAVMGITASGKTKAVSDYLAKLMTYTQDGSLYASIDELTAISNDGLTITVLGLSPYVTVARAKLYRGYIQTYLGIPVTP